MGWRKKPKPPEIEVDEEEAAIVADIVALGYPVHSLFELINSKIRYRTAIPVLLKWLEVVNGRYNRKSVVAALGRPWAGIEALDGLIRAFQIESGSEGWIEIDRWEVGDAIAYLWTDQRYDELVSLACDPRYGEARQMIVYGMRKSKRSSTVDVLLELLDDPDVSLHATEALAALVKKSDDERIRLGLVRMARDERQWIREAAIRGLYGLESTEPEDLKSKEQEDMESST
jgi:HEAT repeat protein